MFNKNHGLILLTLLLLLFSVSGVCATDTDNNTTDYCLSDVNCSNTLTNNLNNHNDDVIYNEDNDIDCCGAIAFQSALKENGINITLEEANKAIHSVNGSTSMQGLIDGARKYNLSAYAIKLNDSNFNTGFIIHMENLNGVNHWASLEEFTNYAIIITKDSNLNINNLDSLECEKVLGDKGRFVREKWKSGLVYVHGRWHMGGYRVLIN